MLLYGLVVVKLVNREECCNLVAKILCGKQKGIDYKRCYENSKTTNGICSLSQQCRIDEKTKEQLLYILAPIDQDAFLEACAGSGKTEVVGMKAAYEMIKWNNVSRKGIAILSFTNEATNVIKKRVGEFLKKGGSVYPHYVGTLSSFIHGYITQPYGYKCIDNSSNNLSFRIVDKEERPYKNHWLIKYCCEIKYIDKDGNKTDIYANQIYFDYQHQDYLIYLGNNVEVYFKEYYRSKQFQDFVNNLREMKQNNWMFGMDYCYKLIKKCKDEFLNDRFANFEDMNNIAYEVMLNNSKLQTVISKRFQLIIIDECQDLSWIEIQILSKLKEKGTILHLVGDINQAIYEFKKVDSKFVKEYVKYFSYFKLTNNFRSCQPIVDISNKLINIQNVITGNNQNKYDANSVLYIEYNTAIEAIEKYLGLLKQLGVNSRNSAIIVKQNKLKNELLYTLNNNEDIHLLISAFQLWNSLLPLNKYKALQLAGKQISKWFGGANSKKNYYCPLDIESAFAWRIFIKDVLEECTLNARLMDFTLQYSDWYKNARSNLPVIFKQTYQDLEKYDKNAGNRNFDNFTYRTPSKIGNLKIEMIDLNIKIKENIDVTTIHGSKGCSFDSVMVISSINNRSDGGHWKNHWIDGNEPEKRIGYVASTRPRYLLVWAVPILKDDDRILLESYGFNSADKVLNVQANVDGIL
ncbi:MAG: UvrD/REP helicase [Firmicutes bacterium]|nr:UvrD/REP helicase [Bacillota bacterium]